MCVCVCICLFKHILTHHMVTRSKCHNILQSEHYVIQNINHPVMSYYRFRLLDLFHFISVSEDILHLQLPQAYTSSLPYILSMLSHPIWAVYLYISVFSLPELLFDTMYLVELLSVFTFVYPSILLRNFTSNVRSLCFYLCRCSCFTSVQFYVPKYCTNGLLYLSGFVYKCLCQCAAHSLILINFVDVIYIMFI